MVAPCLFVSLQLPGEPASDVFQIRDIGLRDFKQPSDSPAHLGDGERWSFFSTDCVVTSQKVVAEEGCGCPECARVPPRSEAWSGLARERTLGTLV